MGQAKQVGTDNWGDQAVRKEQQEALGSEEYDPDLLELKRRCEAAGVSVRLPRPGAKWKDFEPLPIDADEISEMVVRFRRENSL